MGEAACEQCLKSGVAWPRREGFCLILIEEKTGLARRLVGWQPRGTRLGICGVHREFRHHLAIHPAIHLKQTLFTCYRGGNRGLEKTGAYPKAQSQTAAELEVVMLLTTSPMPCASQM